MRVGTFFREHATALVLALDAVVLTAFWYLLPAFKRPFEGLLAVAAVLGVLTTVAARKHAWLPTLAMTAASVAFALFALETLERHFKITDWLEKEPAMRLGEPPHAWDPFDAASYLAARERARRDGVEPEALEEHFGGDVFARLGIAKGRERTSYRGRRRVTTESAGEESPWLKETPIGSELRPNALFRQYCRDEASGRMLMDGVYTIGPHGYRNTRGKRYMSSGAAPSPSATFSMTTRPCRTISPGCWGSERGS